MKLAHASSILTPLFFLLMAAGSVSYGWAAASLINTLVLSGGTYSIAPDTVQAILTSYSARVVCLFQAAVYALFCAVMAWTVLSALAGFLPTRSPRLLKGAYVSTSLPLAVLLLASANWLVMATRMLVLSKNDVQINCVPYPCVNVPDCAWAPLCAADQDAHFGWWGVETYLSILLTDISFESFVTDIAWAWFMYATPAVYLPLAYVACGVWCRSEGACLEVSVNGN